MDRLTRLVAVPQRELTSTKQCRGSSKRWWIIGMGC